MSFKINTVFDFSGLFYGFKKKAVIKWNTQILGGKSKMHAAYWKFIYLYIYLFHFISFHFISFHFISFHFISFYFILFYFILFYFIYLFFQPNMKVNNLKTHLSQIWYWLNWKPTYWTRDGDPGAPLFDKGDGPCNYPLPHFIPMGENL